MHVVALAAWFHLGFKEKNAKNSTTVHNNNNNNNNNNADIYGATIMEKPLREFTRFIW